MNIFLHFIQIGAIIFLIFFTDNTHDHNYNFAKASHSHNYADNYHSHNYADNYHTHIDDNHTHDATEIEYQSFSYGGYGSLQKEIKDLESKINNHTHSAYECDAADSYHTHSAYDCGCASSWHTH